MGSVGCERGTEQSKKKRCIYAWGKGTFDAFDFDWLRLCPGSHGGENGSMSVKLPIHHRWDLTFSKTKSVYDVTG